MNLRICLRKLSRVILRGINQVTPLARDCTLSVKMNGLKTKEKITKGITIKFPLGNDRSCCLNAIKGYALLFLMSSFSTFRNEALRLEGQGEINSNSSTSAAPPTLLRGDASEMLGDHCNRMGMYCNYSCCCAFKSTRHLFWGVAVAFWISPRKCFDTWIEISALI